MDEIGSPSLTLVTSSCLGSGRLVEPPKNVKIRDIKRVHRSRERVVNVHFLLGAVGSNADDSPRVEPVWQKVPLTVCMLYFHHKITIFDAGIPGTSHKITRKITMKVTRSCVESSSARAVLILAAESSRMADRKVWDFGRVTPLWIVVISSLKIN